MKYVFFTFTGYSFPIALQLIHEGNDVVVGQIRDSSELDCDGWQGKKEAPEEKKRRLSLYDGILNKQNANHVLKSLQWEADRGGIKDTFVVVDHNNLCKIGDDLLKMGCLGLIPNSDDYKREKDRKASQDFVKKNYGGKLKILESFSLKKADDGKKIVEESDHLWVLKSNGNLGETIVPKTTSIELNHAQILGALERDGEDYEKGGYLIEQKIVDPIEFTPEIAFWNGEPIYSQVEIECKPIGAGDVGLDGGGAINLTVRTAPEDRVNKLFFPDAVYDMAKKRKGLFIFDAGILFDPKTKSYYFTEFAGNRWSWGGVFSELAMAADGGRVASNYFEDVSAGKNPLRNQFGATVSLYNMLPDGEEPDLKQEGIPIFWDKKKDNNIHFYQIRRSEESFENVGYSDFLLGYVNGCGSTVKKCVDDVYSAVDAISFKEILYRYRGDYVSKAYPSAILNRLAYLTDNGLIDSLTAEDD